MRFIDQENTLLEQSAKLLLKEKSKGRSPFNLSHYNILVPNLQASRMLREALAFYSSKQSSGVLSPKIYTPESLLKHCTKNLSNTASSAQIQWAWAETLCQVPKKHLTGFLPQLPSKRTFSWAVPIANTLITIREQLLTNGWIFKTAYQKIKSHGWDQNRWETWVYLEKTCIAIQKKNQWDDPTTKLLQYIEKKDFPLNIPRLLLLGCPNLSPFLEKCLETLSRKSKIEVWVYASDKEKDYFNQWGRPLKKHWNQLSQDLKFNTNIANLSADTDILAQNITKIWKKEDWRKQQVAVGLLDNDMKYPLITALGSDSYFFDPSKKNNEIRYWLYSLHLWKELLDENSEVFIEWAFQPFIKNQWLENKCPETWLKDFYKCQQKHQFYTINKARSYCSIHNSSLEKPFQLLDQLRINFKQLGVFSFIRNTWELIYNSTSNTVKYSYNIVYDALYQLEKQLSSVLTQLCPKESLTFIINYLSKLPSIAENNDGKISLSGWLDLLWNPAPGLVLIGLHECKLSSNKDCDAYLPDSLKTTLGLLTSDDQYAMNAYIFKRILSSRKPNLQQIWLSKLNTAGEPLIPSRLLFHGNKEDLANRTKQLFTTEYQPNHTPVTDWKGDWKQPLHLPIKKISVTQFADFLQCPFRFYLKNILDMEPLNERKWEMNPRDYGTLFHQCLEKYYQNLKAGTTFSEKSLQNFLTTTLDKSFLNRFGKSENALLEIQKHSLLQRLQSGIPLLLERIDLGWCVEAIEKPFKETHTIEDKTIEISGKIDLIESHPEKGIQLIDFKTFEKAISPVEKHLKKRSPKDEEYPDWQIAIQGQRPSIWIDLQIPIYVNHIKNVFPNRKIIASYLVFPAAIQETGYHHWENLSEELLKRALICRNGVLRKIIQEDFQPIRTSVLHDPFQELIEKGAFKNLSNKLQP